MKQYPKGSSFLLMQRCNTNVVNAEIQILRKLSTICKQRLDIGREYFEGEATVILETVFKQCISSKNTQLPPPTNSSETTVCVDRLLCKFMNSIRADLSGVSTDAFALHDKLIAFAKSADYVGKEVTLRQMVSGLRVLCGASSEYADIGDGTRSLVIKFPQL